MIDGNYYNGLYSDYYKDPLLHSQLTKGQLKEKPKCGHTPATINPRCLNGSFRFRVSKSSLYTITQKARFRAVGAPKRFP